LTAWARALEWVEQGRVPDFVIRRGIRALVRTRLNELEPADPAAAAALNERFVALRDASEVASLPALANQQHYELPQEFFSIVLGPHRKSSCCLFADGAGTLQAAEAQRWWSRWRMFFMACAEMWGYDAGRQWWVSHCLFSRSACPPP
jgi:cyclopropane-fatty-acyl-phospholipid synthase